MVDKEVKKRSKKKLYLYILHTIKTNNSLPKDMTKQKLNYYLKSLKVNNLVVRKGYGVWDLTQLGKQFLLIPDATNTIPKVDKRSKKISKETIRSHAYMFKLTNPKRLLHLDTHKKILDMKKIPYKILVKGNISIPYKNITIHLGKRNIIFYFSAEYSYFSDSALVNDKYAKNDVLQAIIWLERLFQYSLKKNKHYKIDFLRKHHAHVNNGIAKDCKKNKDSFTIKYEGDPWLSVDASNGVPELEAVSSSTATYDSEKVLTPLMNTIKANPNILEDQQKIIELLTKNIQMISDRLFTTEEEPQDLKKLTYIQ